MARPKRFELLTPRFVVWCSIQLSYGRVFARHIGPSQPGCIREEFGSFAKERFSYPLRPELASAGTRVRLLVLSGVAGQNGGQTPPNGAFSRPRPLVTHGKQFHRAVGDRNPEGGTDGALDQMDVAAMGAHQLGRDRQPEPAAARSA